MLQATNIFRQKMTKIRRNKKRNKNRLLIITQSSQKSFLICDPISTKELESLVVILRRK